MAEPLDDRQLLEQVATLFVDRLVVELANRVDLRLEQLAEERGGDRRQALDTKQAAERLGVSERTVRELVMSGELPSVKVGRRRLIAASAIARLLGSEIRGPIGEQLSAAQRRFRRPA